MAMAQSRGVAFKFRARFVRMSPLSTARGRHGMKTLRFVHVPAIALAVALSNLIPSAVSACSLDGIASISLNGTLAVLMTAAPQPNSLGTWARFTFGLAYAPRDVLHLAED